MKKEEHKNISDTEPHNSDSVHRERKGVVVCTEPVQELATKGILQTIRRSGRRGLSVIELKWVTETDIFVILKALKQLQKANLISVRKRHAVHWCYLLHEVA
ncbi:MAG: hypothetical protein AYK19_12375 [Theionarchaea archaeon DG-70-1]|nr:MAG: hypothetical protein AYK19_12375 [Theionarchaea archaeon DG-70-1]